MATLPGSSGTCPWPGVPSSVNAPRPGSSTRSLSSNVGEQGANENGDVRSPNKLCPPESIGPTQRPTIVFCSDAEPGEELLRSIGVGIPRPARPVFPAIVLLLTARAP